MVISRAQVGLAFTIRDSASFIACRPSRNCSGAGGMLGPWRLISALIMARGIAPLEGARECYGIFSAPT
jgi:hypothetical protein